jgi:FixJ family two-component response regulator
MAEPSLSFPICLLDRDLGRAHRLQTWLEDAGFSVACFSSVGSFLEVERSLRPTAVLVVTDGEGDAEASFELLHTLDDRSSPHAVALVGEAQDAQALDAVRAGAVDWVAVGSGKELARLARRAAELARCRGWQRVTERGEAELKRLTPREHETLSLVLAGLPSKSIARQMGVTTKTIEQHRSNVMHKLEVASVAQLVLRALKSRTYGTPYLATPPRE